VAQELDRLGLDVGVPSDRIVLPNGQQPSRQQEQEVQQLRGRAVREALQELMARPGYERWPDSLRRTMVERAIDQARRRANATPVATDMRGRANVGALIFADGRF
jgi:hypothetical protein